MSAEQDLRRAYRMVHNAEQLAKRALGPADFEALAENFDTLIRTLNELAQVEHLLGDTDPGD